MTDERYETLASRHDSLSARTNRDVAGIRQNVNALIGEVQHLQADIKPLLEDLAKRQKGEEQVALLRKKCDEYLKDEWQRHRYMWDANLAVLAERQAELDAALSRRVKIGAVLIRLAALLMLLSLPAAFILSAVGVITPEQQANALAGAALLAIGGGALVMWDTLKESME